MTRYQNSLQTRRESRTIVGRFRGGKLNPVMMHVLRESESCMLNQSVTFELDPIMGQMKTPITAELMAVAVPLQAIHDLALGGSNIAGNTEIIRDALVSGSPLFGLGAETEISRRCGVVPIQIGGVKQVSQICHIAHNAAVNFLRQRKFIDTVKLTAANLSVTPALISQSVLDRFNGVLDPDNRVDGQVQFQTGTITANLAGVFPVNNLTVAQNVYEASINSEGRRSRNLQNTSGSLAYANAPSAVVALATTTNAAGAPVLAAPNVNLAGGSVSLAGLDIGTVSLTDFYNAELMDDLVRQMREMADANPEYGQEMIQRWAHGLSVDMGKTCFMLHESETIFSANMTPATDSAGVTAEVLRSDLMARLSFTLPVPKTELGMIIITFVTVKPDETVDSQPHPFLSAPWVGQKYLADELSRDPVPVLMRELNANIPAGSETTIAFYTGLNEIKRNYVNYGFSRQLDLNTVANKTALWQIKIPLSVGPQSILYPETLDHYPFADQLAEVCTYTISSVQTVASPIIYGPTPVETLAIINTGDLFDEI
jgi:hypothetical protein